MYGSGVVWCHWLVCVSVQSFFEGVENLKAGGTKAEEVGYRLEFSRNELKKCIKEYPGKEVPRLPTFTSMSSNNVIHVGEARTGETLSSR